MSCHVQASLRNQVINESYKSHPEERRLLNYTFAAGGGNEKLVPSCWIRVLSQRMVFLPNYFE